MDWQELGSFIVNNGVAVAALVGCFYFIKSEMKEITVAVNNNTIAITRLVERLEGERHE